MKLKLVYTGRISKHETKVYIYTRRIRKHETIVSMYRED